MTTPDERQTLELDFDLPHAPTRVWRAVTDPELLGQWLLPVFGFSLEPGTRFTFQTEPTPGWDGTVHCRLLEVDPMRSISWAWVVGEIDTVVTLSLTGTEQGTRLHVHQTGFRPDQKREHGGARYGWRMMSERLAGLLADQS